MPSQDWTTYESSVPIRRCMTEPRETVGNLVLRKYQEGLQGLINEICKQLNVSLSAEYQISSQIEKKGK